MTDNPRAAVQRITNRAAGDNRDWIRVTLNRDDSATSGGTAEVLIYDEIGYWGTTASEFVRQISALDVDAIALRLNSPGGEVYDAIAILNALRNHPATVHVSIDGIAASAASFIAMAGDTVTMQRNAEMMVHDASALAFGGPQDMAEVAARLEQVSDNIASMYAERAGGTAGEWRDVMRAETWFSADEAVAAGLADSVAPARSAAGADSKAPADQFNLSGFRYHGRAQAPRPATPSNRAAAGHSPNNPDAATADGHNPNEGKQIVALSDDTAAALRRRLGVPSDADEGTILAALDEALDERADETPTTHAPAALPDGVVTIDRETLDSLRASADLGRKAHEQQQDAARATLVDSAIASGRISPARRDAWLNRLAADPAEAETLNALEPGLIPVAEIGVATDADAADADPITDEQAGYLAAMLNTSKEALRG